MVSCGQRFAQRIPYSFLGTNSIDKPTTVRLTGEDYMIPLGKGNRIREGEQLTLITYGALVSVRWTQ